MWLRHSSLSRLRRYLQRAFGYGTSKDWRQLCSLSDRSMPCACTRRAFGLACSFSPLREPPIRLRFVELSQG